MHRVFLGLLISTKYLWIIIFSLAPILLFNDKLPVVPIIPNEGGLGLIVVLLIVLFVQTAFFGLLLTFSTAKLRYKVVGVTFGLILLAIPDLYTITTTSYPILYTGGAYLVGFIIGMSILAIFKFLNWKKFNNNILFATFIFLVFLYSIYGVGFVAVQASKTVLGGIEAEFEKCHEIATSKYCYRLLGEKMDLRNVDIRTDVKIQQQCKGSKDIVKCWWGLGNAKARQHLADGDKESAVAACNAQPFLGGRMQCCEELRIIEGLPRYDFYECLPSFPVHSLEGAEKLVEQGKFEEAVGACNDYVYGEHRQLCCEGLISTEKSSFDTNTITLQASGEQNQCVRTRP
jgi:hypothetical protein